MDEFEFKTIDDLYKRLLPALSTRKEEISRMGLSNITEIDIWNCLIKNKWKSKKNLRIHELVDDILNIDELVLIEYLK